MPGAAGGAAGAAGAGSAEGGAPGTRAANAANASAAAAAAAAAALRLELRALPPRPLSRADAPGGRAAALCAPPYHARCPGWGRPSSQDTMPEDGAGDGGEVPALIPDGEPLREEVLALGGRSRAWGGVKGTSAEGDPKRGAEEGSPRAPTANDVIGVTCRPARGPGTRVGGRGGAAGQQYGGRLPPPAPPHPASPVL